MASEYGPSKSKTRRIETEDLPSCSAGGNEYTSSTCVKVPCLPEHLQLDLLSALGRICLADINVVKLVPLKIVNCNAANINGGITFSKAFCELQVDQKRFSFGDIFRRGIDVCLNYVEGNVPALAAAVTKAEHIVLNKLVQYLSDDEGIHVDFDTLSEAELTKLLANHLFGKLSTSPCYIIDKKCKSKRKRSQCSCGNEECKLTGDFGDTSIGNGEVWHGIADIVIKNDLIVEVLNEEDTSDSHGDRSENEVKQSSTILSQNPQIVAETIVFSFLQKQRHPEREHFLTPCIGVNNSSLLIMFYDALNDVLLESTKVPLLASDGTRKFSFEAIIVAWLTVNNKFLCTGIVDDMTSFKADFVNQAKDKFEIYQSKLKFTNVGISIEEDKQSKENFVSSRFLLERQNRINLIQQKRFASKMGTERQNE